MNKRILSKILATILVLMLTFSNVIMLAVYAAGETLENQQTSINKTKIEFDAYFKTEDKKVHSMISDINVEDVKLYINIKVTEGNLNNAVAILSNSNFKFKEYKDEQGVIQSIDLQNNKIFFNGISKASDVTLEIPIEIIKDSKIDTDYFKKEGKITLSGEYLNNSGDQMQIEKEIKVLLQIHGEANAIVEQSIDKYVPFNTEEAKGTLLQSTVKVGVEDNNLPIKQAQINIDVPVINDVKPSYIVVVGKEYSYNEQTGILTITISNEVEDGQISWNKNGLFSNKIIYLYGQDAYTNEEVTIKQKVQTVISVYNDKEKVVNKTSDGELKVTEKINDNVTNIVSINKQELYKGFLYNNSKNETTYQTTWLADIGYTNLVKEISLSEYGDKYVYNTISNEDLVPNYAYYKATYIAKENFERILGLDGYIDIYDANGNKIGTINKDSNIDEYNNYVFNYTNELNQINIKTSKPVENILGEELIIKNDKGINSSVNYNLDWLRAFTQIKTSLNEKEAYVDLKEVQTTIEASVNKNILSTAVNNNVEFTVSLRTDSSRYQLYKNPVIEIKLPSYIETIELGNIDILYGNSEFNIVSRNVYVDEVGNKVIRIALAGEQTDYTLNSTSKGINVFVSANIQTSKFMSSQQENVEVKCINGKDNSVAVSNIEMNFISESGILMANSISGFNGNESITSLKGSPKVGRLEMNAASKQATMDITLINNEKEDVSEVVVLGRLPFKGNKTVASEKELGSTFTAELKSFITASGIDASIYYSENEDADKDLQKEENRWSQEATTGVKSYLIVFNETFKKGQTVNFKYEVTIPENLGTDKAAYSNYAVYYNSQVFDSPVIGMATELIMIEQYRDQIEDQNRNVRILNSNNTTRGDDLVTVNTQYYIENSTDSNIGVDEVFNYMITINNKSTRTLRNINIVDALGGNVRYIESNVLSQNNDEETSYNIPVYNENNHNVTFNIFNLPANESVILKIKVSATNYSSSGIINQYVVSSNDIYMIDTKTIQMKSPAIITASMSGSIMNEELNVNQTVKYTILVNNTGGDIANVNVICDLPEGLILKNANYYIEGINNNVDLSDLNQLDLSGISILPGTGIKILMEAEVVELPEDISERELEIFAIIEGTDIYERTNSVTYTIKNENNSNNIEDTDYIKKSISGVIWQDENKNGKRDSQEAKIENISVKLLNSSGQVVGETQTDNQGNYRFGELNKDSYIVMFEYDSKLYSVTTYKKDDVIDTLNSDAKETIYNGNKVAVTDMIEINKSSKTNIDLGLIKNSLFDLKLDKYISAITVQNDQGVTTYNYTDTNFAKVELAAKYIPSTVVVLEYRIVATNEGDIPGYVKQIVDYLPQDLKFSSELNKDWYVNTDGNLYSSSLSNEIINPGETKEINLIVSKKMTENNTGLVINQAEIAQSYNEQQITEYDSIAANKNQNEDDIGTANVIVGVKTGGAVLYITITLICISIIIVGVYLIDKKVLRGIK